MDREYTRRAIAAAILGGGVGASVLSPAESFLDRFAALSGTAWDRATSQSDGRIESEFGAASVTYDDFGVPTVEAEDELAGFFAIGYVHGRDRLFQMDLFRRRMRGQLSAIVGEVTLESDRFNRRMNFAAAADATWERLRGTEVQAPIEAYAEGVNTARERTALPIEFGLLEYEPSHWRPVDTLIMEKQISWGLTGSFQTLRRATVADTFDEEVFAELFPRRFDHDSPIIREDSSGTIRGEAAGEDRTRSVNSDPSGLSTALDPDEVARLSSFESPPSIGSNSWVISGSHTENGQALVANDPHLTLTVPPLWYEQRHEFPDRTVHGVTFPGAPFIIIGYNQAGAWGVTNSGADVLDVYTYETADGRYRYREEFRDFEEREERIEVADGPDETLTVRETVHGPIVTREGREVAVQWTGMTGTATALSVYRIAQSDGRDDVLQALRDFDLPTQNFVYGDRDGNTLYQVTGRIPRRFIDGEPVTGDRVFDGSAPEGEWRGFTPYGQSNWDGFVPFEEKPAVIDPDWIGTANQRIIDDPRHPIAEAYSDPFRGIRLNERLRELTGEERSLDTADMRALQRDTIDHRARLLVPAILAAASEEQAEFVAPLEAWDHRMDRESEAALIFEMVWHAYREQLYGATFEDRGLSDESYWPADWVTATLSADAHWFTVIGQSREAVLRGAIDTGRERIEEKGYERYGELNTVDIAHPLQQEFLGYQAVPTAGSSSTLFNVHRDGPHGSSWRMVVESGAGAHGILPGGNSGDYFDPHYRDQLTLWATGRYRDLVPAAGEPTIQFEGGDDG